jgi:Tfp pilus assembly protein PilX
MSANMVDRNEAVQAAETGLLVAQRTVINGTFNNMWNGSTTFTALGGGGSSCVSTGICDRSNPANAATWQTAPDTPATWVTMANGARYGFTVEFLGNAKGESSEVRGVCNTSSAPRYLCERPLFRVTSYGRGRGVAQVVLQTNIISQPR